MCEDIDVSVTTHRSDEDLILYLSRELEMDYAAAKEYYEQEATIIT